MVIIPIDVAIKTLITIIFDAFWLTVLGTSIITVEINGIYENTKKMRNCNDWITLMFDCRFI